MSIPDNQLKVPTSAVVSLEPWLWNRASKAEADGNWGAAVDEWRRLLRFKGKKTEATAAGIDEIHFRLGVANLKSEQAVKGLFHLREAIRLNPSRAEYFEAFGRAFGLLGDWKLARQNFEKSIALNPKSDQCWAHYAGSLYQLRDLDAAERAAKQACRLNPDSEKGLFIHVMTLTEMHRWQEVGQKLKIWRNSGRHSDQLRAGLELSRRRYRLSLQGAVHVFLRKRMKVDGHPLSILDLRAAERAWIRFCREQPEFGRKRANLRLVRIWTAALVCMTLESKTSVDIESLSREFEVKSYELMSAHRILKEPPLGARIAPDQ